MVCLTYIIQNTPQKCGIPPGRSQCVISTPITGKTLHITNTRNNTTTCMLFPKVTHIIMRTPFQGWRIIRYKCYTQQNETVRYVYT
jgi:hypothetical protein